MSQSTTHPTALVQSIDARTRFLDDLATTGQYDHPAWKSANHVARYDAAAGQCKFADPGAKALPDQADDDAMAIPFVISTLSQDRDGDVLVPGGCKSWLPAYAKNPIVLFAHSSWLLPIGVARDKGGKCTVQVLEDRVLATCFFHKETEIARDTYRLVKAGILGAASVGFIPHKGKRLKRPERDSDAGPEVDDGTINFGWPGFLFTEWELCEFSVVVIQSNRDAIRLSLDKGIDGRPLGDQARHLIRPFAPHKASAVVGGWEHPSPTVFVPKDQFATEAAAAAHIITRGLDASDCREDPAGWIFRQPHDGHFCRPAGGTSNMGANQKGDGAGDHTGTGGTMTQPNTNGGTTTPGAGDPARKGRQVPKSALAALAALYGIDLKELATQTTAFAAEQKSADERPVPPGATILVGIKEVAEAALPMTEQADVLAFLETTLAAANKCAGKAYPKIAEGLGFKEPEAGDDEDEEEETDDQDDDDTDGDESDDDDGDESDDDDTDDEDSEDSDDLTEDEAKEFEELRARFSNITGVAV